MKLSNETLEKLYKLFMENDSVLTEQIEEIVGEDNASDAVDQLKKKYPNLKYEVEAAKAKRAEQKAEPQKSSDKKDFTVVLINESGFGEELEITGIKGDKIYTKKKIPTDLVTVKIGGKDVEINLLDLDKEAKTHNLSVQTLSMLGKIAKGE